MLHFFGVDIYIPSKKFLFVICWHLNEYIFLKIIKVIRCPWKKNANSVAIPRVSKALLDKEVIKICSDGKGQRNPIISMKSDCSHFGTNYITLIKLEHSELCILGLWNISAVVEGLSTAEGRASCSACYVLYSC